ncbi:4Fe-4S double cluster binding domain-containing protein [Chloroflexota bacterium]
MDELTKQRFRAEPALFLTESIKAYTLNSPLNRLPAFGGAAIFEAPLVGFAGGDDPIFTEYKTIISDFHLTPREALTGHLTETLGSNPKDLPTVSVVSIVLPIARDTKLSNRRETKGPSLRWNHTRWQGQDFITDLTQYVASLLKDLGHYAVVPELAPFFEMRELPDGLGSVWSLRHIAYAAGLGTFGLSDGFITPKGMALRCASIVTDLEIPPSHRPYPGHQANCLFHSTGTCGRCIKRCPGGAISEKGHDKKRCLEVLVEEQKPWMDGVHGDGYIGAYAGCGLCQTKVPCESGIPPAPKHR